MKSILADRFQAQSDDGQVFIVNEYRRLVQSKSLAGRSTALKGTSYWRLSNGFSVNQIDSETYQIVSSDLIIRKI